MRPHFDLTGQWAHVKNAQVTYDSHLNQRTNKKRHKICMYVFLMQICNKSNEQSVSESKLIIQSRRVISLRKVAQ